MKMLSRAEEIVLLAVWKLQDDAYCVPIREQLMRITGRNWSFGSVYDPLDRLERKGLLASHLSEPSPTRGGRSKRIYTLSKSGLEALIEIKSLEESMWKGITKPALESRL